MTLVSEDLDNYRLALYNGLAQVDQKELERAVALIERTIQLGGTIYVAGNGGSAAIANHLSCDFLKGIATDTYVRPKVVSLSNNIELITAISNDISYDEIFSYQLRTFLRYGSTNDLIILVSSSGNSKNILLAKQIAFDKMVSTVSFVGFDGGLLKKKNFKGDAVLHVPVNNYGIVEDSHQALCHVISQYLRKKYLNVPLKSIKL